MIGVKLIDGRIWVGNIREIIPKDHQSVLEERPKICMQAVPGRPLTEQSTASHGCDAPSKGPVRGLYMGEYSNLRHLLLSPTEACERLLRW